MAQTSFQTSERGSTLTVDLPIGVWFGLPTALLLSIVIGRMLGADFYGRWFYGELRIVELVTFACSLAASVTAISAWRLRRVLPSPYLGWWLIVFALGAFYFAGEEASWGQHLLGWSTPEQILALNDHGETNLHNITNWADEKPKQLVDLASMIGGIVLPIFILLRGIRLDPRSDWRYWFVPTVVVVPACLFGAGLKTAERLRDAFGLQSEDFLNMRMSEPQEMYFSLFFLLYAWSINRRLRHQVATSGS